VIARRNSALACVVACLLASPASAGLWDAWNPPLKPASEEAFKPIAAIPPHDGLPESVPADLFGIMIGLKFDEAREALLKHVPGKALAKICNPVTHTCEAPIGVDEFNQPIYSNYETTQTKLYIQDPCPKTGCPTNLRLTSSIAGMNYRSAIRASQSLPDGSSENFRLLFSSPGSGHQLVDLLYTINYPADHQPRFEDWLSQIREKFQAEPIILNPPQLSQAALVYANGWLTDTSSMVNGGRNSACGVPFPDSSIPLESKLKTIEGAQCRLVVKVVLTTGASPRHVGQALVEIWDPYRAAANLVSDIKSLYSSRDAVERKLDIAAPKL